MPSGVAHFAHLREMAVQLAAGLVEVSSGAPDSSNWPPGSSEMAPPPVEVGEADDVAARR